LAKCLTLTQHISATMREWIGFKRPPIENHLLRVQRSCHSCDRWSRM